MLLLVKFGVRTLDLADAVLERIDNLVGRRHRLPDFVLLSSEVCYLDLKRSYLHEEGFRALHLLNLFHKFGFIILAPVGCAETLLQLLDSLLELIFVVVDGMNIFTHFLKVLIEALDLALDFLNASKTLLFLLIILI